MSERVKPALTPSEWIDVIEGVESGNHTWSHATAAQALYGQPFGFTREDVRLCRKRGILSLSMAKEPHPDDPARRWWDEARAMDDLADRIEALLPPEPAEPSTP